MTTRATSRPPRGWLPPWATRLAPELSHVPEGEPRRAAWRRAVRGCGWGYAFTLVAAGLTLVALASQACLAADPRLPVWYAFPVGVAILLCPLLALLFAEFISHWLWRHRIRRKLRRLLAEGGLAICIQCGYDLRGAAGEVCSECGAAIVLATADVFAHAADGLALAADIPACQSDGTGQR